MDNNFDLDLAKRIAAEHGLSANTVASWRQRGAIPAKYTTDLRASKAAIDALVALLAVPGVSVKDVCYRADISKAQYDAMVGRGSCAVSPDQARAAADWLQVVANNVCNVLGRKEVDEALILVHVLSSDYIRPGMMFDNSLRIKISKVRNGHALMTEKLVKEITPAYMEFAAELKRRIADLKACL